MTRPLPPRFIDLAPFTEKWVLKNEKERHLALLRTDIEELRVFYGAMVGRLQAIADYLNSFPLDQMPPEAQNLFDLAMTFVETVHPIELNWRKTDITDAVSTERFEYLQPSCGAPG
jgi:hypothetical protein